MDLYDDKLFVFAGPVWIVVHESIAADLAFLRSDNGLLCGQADRANYVAIFTDNDLAQRCIEREGLKGFRAEPFTSPGEFREFLEMLRGKGHTHVGIDGNGKVRVVSIERMLAGIDRGPV